MTDRGLAPVDVAEEMHSPISWSAIIAGAASAMAAAIVVASVATGIGFKTAASWPGAGLAPGAFTPTAGAAMVLAQVLCFALGGYVAGRLRVKWANVHTHEVFFRDTAHGLLAWAIATIGGAILVTGWAAGGPQPPLSPLTQHQADIAAQAAYFAAVGLALGAFVSAVAGALGGMRRDDMHALHRAP